MSSWAGEKILLMVREVRIIRSFSMVLVVEKWKHVLRYEQRFHLQTWKVDIVCWEVAFVLSKLLFNTVTRGEVRGDNGGKRGRGF